jgi:hypothetical protein
MNIGKDQALGKNLGIVGWDIKALKHLSHKPLDSPEIHAHGCYIVVVRP